MASRSLGLLTLDLVARIGGFEKGMDQASRKSDETAKRARKAAKETADAWSGVGKAITAGFAGITIGATIAKFAKESREAQDEQAQLAAVLKSTGEAAGYSQGKLNEMAESMANSSIFSDGEINKAQTRLLSYTGIVGEKFPEAMQSVIDMAARMGMTVEQSAETVGRALDIPSQGLTALTKQGFRFTEEQKKLVTQLEATGRTGEAQAIILEALQSSYGGAAEAARHTFGGSLTALQNQLDELMTGKDGSLDGAAKSINELTDTLNSESTKAAFASLTAAIADIISLLAKASVAFVEFGEFVGEALAKAAHGSADPVERIDEQLKTLRLSVKNLNSELGFNSFMKWLNDIDDEQVRQKLGAANKQIADLLAARQQLLNGAGAAVPSAQNNSPDRPVINPGPSGSAKTATSKKDEYTKYLESLQKEINKVSDLTRVEQVLADVQSGRLGKLSAAQIGHAVALGEQIESIKQTAEAWSYVAASEEKALQTAQDLIVENQKLANSYRDAIDPSREIHREMEKIQELVDSGFLAPDEGMEAQIAHLKEAYKDLGEEMDTFAKRAAKNIQDSIGEGLVNIMDGNFKDIGSNFARMLQQMAADAVAANLARSMFGDMVQGGSGNGMFGSLLAGMGEFFGISGNRADGGPVMANSLYRVNERGPEILETGGKQYLMTGPRGGNVIPNGEGMPAAVGMAGGKASPAIMNIEVNLTNAGGQKMEVQSAAPRFDGEKMILDVLLKDLRTNGPYARQLKGSMG